MMKKQRFNLGFLMIVYTIVSLVIALGVFMAVNTGGSHLLSYKLYTKEYILDTEKQLLDDYIEYLNDNSKSLNSREAGIEWLNGRDNIMIAIYNGGHPFGNNENATGVILISASSDAPAMFELLQNEYADYWYTCPIMMLGDMSRTKLVRVMYYPMYAARRIVVYTAAGLAFGAFVVSLLLFIRRKTRYIAYLSRQLNMMEGGELSVPLVMKGSDELTSLAGNMDKMRLSFIERLEHEEEIDRSSRELMTAMSHDLRTPLTALMGYLEIVDSGTIKDEEKNREFISSALKRARQLKGMTDELFEYFLVYSTGDSAPELETVDAMTVFMQLWDESSFSLESEGFTVETLPGEESCEISVNVQLIRRVIDNIASNIRKYADKSEAVRFSTRVEGGMFEVRVTNRVGVIDKAESSGIGLMSCRKVLAAHNGSFEAGQKDGVFEAVIRIPAGNQDH